MRIRFWIGAGSAACLAIAAGCGQAPAPSAASPTPAAASAAWPGVSLVPGTALTGAGRPGLALFMNAAEREARLDWRFTAPGQVLGPPVSSPSPEAPTPEPTPAAPASAPPTEAPPFQARPGDDDGAFFDAIGTGTGRVPPTTRRLFQAASAPPSVRQVGTTETFWINTGDTRLEGDVSRPAKLLAATETAYFYLDASQDADRATPRLTAMAEAFASRIRPALLPIFGATYAGGPDGETRLTVVISDVVGSAVSQGRLLGYFWPRDAVPPGGEAGDPRLHSNGRDVIFLSAAILEEPIESALGTLAHEYQHLLMFHAKSQAAGVARTEAVWLDEGAAMLAMDLAGYGIFQGERFVCADVAAFLAEPARYALTAWKENPNGYAYGQSYLFMRYLVDRFGTGVIRALQARPETGLTALTAVLGERGTSLPALYAAWAIALLPASERPANFPSAWRYSRFDPEGRYGEWALGGLKLPPAPPEARLNVRPWGLAGYAWPASDAARWETRGLAGRAAVLTPASPIEGAP